MDLTNKHIKVTSLIANSFPVLKTTVTFSIYEDLSPTLSKFLDEYTLLLDNTYIPESNSTELLQLIIEQLTGISTPATDTTPAADTTPTADTTPAADTPLVVDTTPTDTSIPTI